MSTCCWQFDTTPGFHPTTQEYFEASTKTQKQHQLKPYSACVNLILTKKKKNSVTSRGRFKAAVANIWRWNQISYYIQSTVAWIHDLLVKPVRLYRICGQVLNVFPPCGETRQQRNTTVTSHWRRDFQNRKMSFFFINDLIVTRDIYIYIFADNSK